MESDSDERKIRNREASRRFRARQKNNKIGMLTENQQLKEELEATRRELELLKSQSGDAISGMREGVQQALQTLNKRLPLAVSQALITNSMRSSNIASNTVTRMAQELAKSIHPLAYVELNLWSLMTWLQMRRSGHMPTDPFLQRVYMAFDGIEFEAHPVSEAQKEALMGFLASREVQYLQAMDTKRRLRSLIEEVGRLAAQAERDDAWLAAEHQPFVLRTFRPEQCAARWSWAENHMEEMQERVIGRRLGQPSSPSEAPRGRPPRHAGRLRRRRPPGGGVGAAPEGAGIAPDVLRAIIESAVAQELASFLQDPSMGPYAAMAPPAPPAPLPEPEPGAQPLRGGPLGGMGSMMAAMDGIAAVATPVPNTPGLWTDSSFPVPLTPLSMAGLVGHL
eukprot:tig00000792_g4190.t1